MTLRLNWGCGDKAQPGWINSDVVPFPGVNLVADIRHGLPVADHFFDYIVSIHALPEIAYADMDRVLRELHRVLKPGGYLRLGLPDFDKAIAAYKSGDVDYFLIGDDVIQSLAGKLIVQLTWYGRSRCLFTLDFVSELLTRNGFADVKGCDFTKTQSPHLGIAALDNRPLESFFVEACKPALLPISQPSSQATCEDGQFSP